MRRRWVAMGWAMITLKMIENIITDRGPPIGP
jgi:hypothetical protein